MHAEPSPISYVDIERSDLDDAVDERAQLGQTDTPRASRVRVQLFPLMADRVQMQNFLDGYFNAVVPPEVAVFKPAFGMIFCSLLDYREMSDGAAWSTGVMSQYELYFLMPLDRYRLVDGQLEFVEHAVTTPYIFVDNTVSAIAGRERFGFPKQDSWFQQGDDGPLPPLEDALRLITVKAYNPGKAGLRLDPFFHVVRDPNTAVIDQPIGPSVTPPRKLPNRIDLIQSAAWIAKELKARAFDPGPLHEIKGQWREILEGWDDEGMCINVYNLRQFSHPGAIRKVRYQDLVRMRMRLAGIQELRSFKERLGSDATFSLIIHRQAIRPIVDNLGIRVADRKRGAESEGNPTVDITRVMEPTFAQADVDLVSTERIAWRFQHRGWRDKDGRQLTPDEDSWPTYNVSLGPAAASFLAERPEEPIHDVKYMMLAACAKRVREFIAREIIPARNPVPIRLLTVGDLTAIRVIVSRSRPRRPNLQEELVWLDGNYCSFSVPVSYTHDGQEHFAHLLLRDFTDNTFMLQALRELASSPTDSGKFDTVDGNWFSTTSDQVRLLTLRAEAIDRSPNEARLSSQAVLDMFTVLEDEHDVADDNEAEPDAEPDVDHEHNTDRSRAAVAALSEALWPYIKRPLPVLSFGDIVSPGDPSAAIEQRLMRTTLNQRLVHSSPPPAANRRYYAQFHYSETFPLITDFGLERLPSDAWRALMLREGMEGRIDAVRVTRFGQAALSVYIEDMEVLWQTIDVEPVGRKTRLARHASEER